MGTDFTPKKDGDDPLVRLPLSIRLDGFDALSEGAQQVVIENTAQINRFVYRNRQDVSNSSIAVHKRVLSHPDVDVTYLNHYGHERLTVSPRPQSQGEVVVVGGVPEEEQQDYDFVYVPITPDTLLFVVLYKDNRMAAYAMGSLSSKDGVASAERVGSEVRLQGTSFGSGMRPVNQVSLSGLGVILTWADFLGKSDGTSMMISTTALFDAIATDGISGGTPIMAGTGTVSKNDLSATVYTTVGTYKFGQGKWTKLAGAPKVAPYAIKPDGTSYYPGSYFGIAVHNPSGVSKDDALPKTLATLADDDRWKDKQRPTAPLKMIEAFEDNDGVVNKLVITKLPDYVDFGLGITGWAGGEWNLTTTINDVSKRVLTYGSMYSTNDPVNVANTLSTSYWVSGAYGQEPQVHDYLKAVYPGTYPIFDVDSKATTTKLGVKTTTDQDGTLPRATFDLKAKDTPIDVTLDQVQGSAEGRPVLTQGEAFDHTFRPAAQIEGFDTVTPIHTDFTKDLPVDPPTGGHYGFLSGGYEDKTSGGHQGEVYFGAVPQAVQGYVEDGNTLTTVASAGVAITIGNMFFVERGPQLIGTSVIDQKTYSTFIGHGAFASPDKTTTYTDNSSQSGLNEIDLFSFKLGDPHVSFTSIGSWSWNGYKGDNTKTITYYPWPPGPVNGKVANCYFAEYTGTGIASDPDADSTGVQTTVPGSVPPTDPDLTTPFKMLKGTLNPFIHCSNADHYVQGFTVTSVDATKPKPYLFLDDAGADLMAFLKKDLGIEDSDFVSCYMDIPVHVFTRITKIKT